MSRKGSGTHAFRTPSGGVSAHGRRAAERRGDTMPGGRFPIRDVHDLADAKHDFGRAKDKPAVRRWIDKRARQLGEPGLGETTAHHDGRAEAHHSGRGAAHR